jgi:hypothetical protein
MVEDQATEKKMEEQAEIQMRHIIANLRRGKDQPAVRNISPDSPEMWFTQLPAVKLTDAEFTDFKNRKIMVLFSGLIEYSDKYGVHKTYYCVSNNGNSRVIFLCGIAGEL